MRFLKLIFCLFLIFLGPFPLAAAEPQTLLILDSEDGPPYIEAREAMLEELKTQGFIPGENLKLTRYSLDNQVGTGIRLLRAEADKHDVVFINGTIASKAAYEYGFKQPQHKFIFCSVTDPIGLGLIQQFDHPPDANFTGVAYAVPVAKRLRFLKRVLPEADTLAVIHSDLPQSKSYNDWLKSTLNEPEFSDLTIIFVEVPYVRGEYGSIRMSRLIAKHVKELSPVVDAFLTPNDQMGVKPFYDETVKANSNKPLLAIIEQELSEGRGAHFGAYPDQEKAGQLTAKMIAGLLNGQPLTNYTPTHPDILYGIHKPNADSINLQIPWELWQNDLIQIFYQ